MYRSIVAVYDGLSDPSALRSDLEAAGVASSEIHVSTDRATGAVAPAGSLSGM